jgi:hypothetical protein
MQPYPRAPERKETIRRSKSGQSQIHTNTPDKTQIVAGHTERLDTRGEGISADNFNKDSEN